MNTGKRSQFLTIFALLLTAVLPVTACGAPAGQNTAELQKVRVGLSAFQDVMSIYVGIEKGFYRDEGIELEIQRTDWPGANELLTGGHVDMATSSDADIALQNGQGNDTTLAFPLFYFAGSGFNYDAKRHDWKTFDAFLQESNGDRKEALKKTLEQLKGKKVGVSSGGGEYATFVGMVKYTGLNVKDFQVVDLAQEELPPALISNSIDIMIAGIPQRLAALKQGYPSLLDQTALPTTIVHAGFAAHRKWIDENPELAAKIEKVILKTLGYIEKNPDEAFPIISKHLKESGTVVASEDLKQVWNKMEYFPNGKDWYQQKVVNPEGEFYWKDRFQAVVTDLQETGKMKELKVPLEDLNYGLKVVESID